MHKYLQVAEPVHREKEPQVRVVLEKAAPRIDDLLGKWPPRTTLSGELLFSLISERRSTIITTNLAFSERAQVLGDEELATAMLGRLGYRAHILTTNGPSHRMSWRKKEGK